MYNDENMLMTDLELVDEQEWEDAMRDAYEAMAAMDRTIKPNKSDIIFFMLIILLTLVFFCGV